MIDLTTTDGVLDWWVSDGSSNVARPRAEALAKGMRYKAVWEQHRDNLSHIVSPRQYNMVNRQSMVRAVRAFVCAMERAEMGDVEQ